MADLNHHSANDLVPDELPKDLIIVTTAPRHHPTGEESIEFHAARILLLLKYAGGRRAHIVGRVKLAKLDFFLRYPAFLSKALGEKSGINAHLRPESPMIRFKYGPWDAKYYDIFAFLVSKDLMSITPSKGGDEFRLTDRGNSAVEELQGPDFEEIIQRCRLLEDRFKEMTGSQIKDYIYEMFPGIVAMPLGSEIEG